MVCPETPKDPSLREILQCADLDPNHVNQHFGSNIELFEKNPFLFITGDYEGKRESTHHLDQMNINQLVTVALSKDHHAELNSLMKPFGELLVKMENISVIKNQTLPQISQAYFQVKPNLMILGEMMTQWLGHNATFLSTPTLDSILAQSDMDLKEFLKIPLGTFIPTFKSETDPSYHRFVIHKATECMKSDNQTLGELTKSCGFKESDALHTFFSSNQIPSNFQLDLLPQITKTPLQAMDALTLSLVLTKKARALYDILDKEPITALIVKKKRAMNTTRLGFDTEFENMTLLAISSSLTDISPRLFSQLVSDSQLTVHQVVHQNNNLNVRKVKATRLSVLYKLSEIELPEVDATVEINKDIREASLLKFTDLLMKFNLMLDSNLEVHSSSGKKLSRLDDLVMEAFGIKQEQFLQIFNLKDPSSSLLNNYTIQMMFHLSLTKTPAIIPGDAKLRDLVTNMLSIEPDFVKVLSSPVKDLLKMENGTHGKDLKTSVLTEVRNFILMGQYNDARVEKNGYFTHFQAMSIENLKEQPLIFVMQRAHSGLFINTASCIFLFLFYPVPWMHARTNLYIL